MAVWATRETTERIAALGWYLATRQQLEATGALRYVREVGEGYRAAEIADLAAAQRRSRAIDALNRGRVWARRRFLSELDALLAPGIAVCIVPSHTPFGETPPLRLLGQALAARQERHDATGCLVRHTPIRRISFGGPSYRGLHRQTIDVVEQEKLIGRPVAVIDDIARSGASLRACRELLLEAGAEAVQMIALGRTGG